MGKSVSSRQTGFSIMEAMVAALVLAIAGFAFVASQVSGIMTQKESTSKHAAMVAGQQAAESLIALTNKGQTAVAAALAAYPRSIYSPETRKNLQVSIARVEDSSGSAVNIGTLPVNAVLTVVLSVPYVDGRQQQTVKPVCTVSY
ncbi:MAG: hypothetical protein AB1400_11290 [Pseudomonadota bacterium]